MFTTISALSDLHGPSGEEERVQDWCERAWAPHCLEIVRTPIGNLVAKVGGSGPRILLLAHADEIGLIVKSVTENGLLHVWPGNRDHVGRPGRWQSPVNNPVVVMGDRGDVDGQLVFASGHVRGGQLDAEATWNDWFVDVGAASALHVAELGIHPGSRVVTATRARRLGDTVVGKAMDDRIGLAVITALLERLDIAALQYELWVGSSVLEENAMMGAAGIADLAAFRFCVNLEVGLCGDTPGVSPVDFPARLRGGPILVHQDAGVNYSPRITRHLASVAVDAGIAVQHAVFQYFSTDGQELIRRGVETALVTVPTRYTHTPNEMVATSDVEGCVALLTEFLTRSALDPRVEGGRQPPGVMKGS